MIRLLVQAVTLWVTLASALALPVGLDGNEGSYDALSKRAAILPPRAGLPTPQSQNLRFQVVALGIGTQQWTCVNGAARPRSEGASAALFNAASYLNDSRFHGQNMPALFVQRYDVNSVPLPRIGQHFFNANGAPGFEISDPAISLRLIGRAAASTPAPADAFPGVNGDGAVDWTLIRGEGKGGNRNSKAAYRVRTAGGKPDPNACANGVRGDFTVKFAAEYWFYN